MISFQFLLKIFHFHKLAACCSGSTNSTLFPHYQIIEKWTQWSKKNRNTAVTTSRPFYLLQTIICQTHLVKHFDESSFHGDTVWEDLKTWVKTKHGMNEENSSTLGFSELQANVLKYALICTSKGDSHPVSLYVQSATGNASQAHWQYASICYRGLRTSNIGLLGVHKLTKFEKHCSIESAQRFWKVCYLWNLAEELISKSWLLAVLRSACPLLSLLSNSLLSAQKNFMNDLRGPS